MRCLTRSGESVRAIGRSVVGLLSSGPDHAGSNLGRRVSPSKQRSLCAALAIGVAGLVAGGLSAHGQRCHGRAVPPADLITSLSDVRSAGHYDFLAEGIHVKTDDTTSNAKVALYFR